MNNPSEIIDTMIEYESQCIDKYDSYMSIYSDINTVVANGTPLNNILVPSVYANIRILLPECDNLIKEISGLINNALTVYDICEIYRNSDKTEETINAERTLEGCLTNMKSYIFKYNALCSQIEQHLQIAKDRITTQNI